MAEFASLLSAWQWIVLALVPPALVLLYFLKLRRQPLEVPSTYLWHKMIEDLHVNSIWQRLRNNLLLYLQLLLVILAMAALAAPGCQQTQLSGERFIFLIDHSASMSSRDVAAEGGDATRLEAARRLVRQQIEHELPRGASAMVIGFADSARVLQTWTDNRQALLRGVQSLQPSSRRTSLLEALRLAAGLSNPSRTGAEDKPGEIVAEALPATLFIYSDGGFADPDFALGTLSPRYVRLGTARPHNVAITAFDARASEDRPDELQAFARLENYGPLPQEFRAELYLDDTLVDVQRVRLPARATPDATPPHAGVVFTGLTGVASGVLRLTLEFPAGARDDLALDNTAWVALSPQRRSNVLLVTPGNKPLELALQTRRAARLADATIQGVAYLQTEEYRQRALGGAWDLIIYDRCLPPEEESPLGEVGPDGPDAPHPTAMPAANTLFIGRIPKLPSWGYAGMASAPWPGEPVAFPQIIDTQRSHPLMRLLEMSPVLIVESLRVPRPAAGTVLLDSTEGPLLVIAPRGRFEDAVLGFEIVGERESTNWPLQQSFPVFVHNLLRYLGGRDHESTARSIAPGETIELRLDTPHERIEIQTPQGDRLPLGRGPTGTFSFARTEALGPYTIRAEGEPVGSFAVNLLDARESDLQPRDAVQIRYTQVAAQPPQERIYRELWPWVLILALAVLALEWYIYVRRVHL
jgi:hypothetical protein